MYRCRRDKQGTARAGSDQGWQLASPALPPPREEGQPRTTRHEKTNAPAVMQSWKKKKKQLSRVSGRQERRATSRAALPSKAGRRLMRALMCLVDRGVEEPVSPRLP